MSQSETSLLQRFVRAGDPEVFSEITRLYAGMVYGTCLRITGNQEHAADAAQETFYHLLKNATRITGSLGGWLHQVAVRRAIDLVRRDASRRRHEFAFAANAEAVETDQWADVLPLVDESISELEGELRDILLRHYLQGQSTVQIAAACGISQPTASRRIEQALEQLRGKLRAKGVLVTTASLLGLMPNATTSVPGEVLQGLGKIALTGSKAAASLANAIFCGLGTKVAVPAVIALLGVAGFVASQSGDAGSGSPSNSANWGEAVEGLQARLHTRQTNWDLGTTPRLFVDVRNQGTRSLLFQMKYGCEVEVDGQWFRKPVYTRETRALPSPFPPGRQYDNLVIDLDNSWQEAGEAAKRLGQIKRLKDQITPGQHVLRVAVTATADKTGPGKPVRAISNPVEIKILSGRPTEPAPGSTSVPLRFK